MFDNNIHDIYSYKIDIQSTLIFLLENYDVCTVTGDVTYAL